MSWFNKKEPEPQPVRRPRLEVFPDNVKGREYQHPDYDEILIKRGWCYVIFVDGYASAQSAIWSEEECFTTWQEAQEAGRRRMEEWLA